MVCKKGPGRGNSCYKNCDSEEYFNKLILGKLLRVDCRPARMKEKISIEIVLKYSRGEIITWTRMVIINMGGGVRF